MVAAPTRYSLQGWHRNANEVPRPRWSVIIPRTALHCTVLHWSVAATPPVPGAEPLHDRAKCPSPPLPYLHHSRHPCHIPHLQDIKYSNTELPHQYSPSDPAQ